VGRDDGRKGSISPGGAIGLGSVCGRHSDVFSNAIPGAPGSEKMATHQSDPNYAGTIRRKIKQHFWLSITDTRMIDSSLNDIRTER
jgi:hypothetical protein